MRSFDGTSYLSTSTFNNSVALSYPLSISAWFVLKDTAIGRVANVNSVSGGSVVGSILTNYPTAGFVTNQWYGNNSLPASKNKAGVGTLNHCLITVGAVYHTIYLNGVRGASAATTGTVSGCVYLEIGRVMGGQGFNGLVGEVAVWCDVLNYSDAQQLYTGESPLTIRQSKLLEYYPLRDHDKPYFNRPGNALTVSGATWNARQPPLPPLKPQRWATPLNNYSLTAAQGSYSLAGQSADLSYGRTVAADQGSFSINGQDAGLISARTLTSDFGSFTVTGQDAGLNRGYTIAAGQGSYSFAGQNAELLATRTIVAEQGSYSFTGQDVGMIAARTITAVQGNYSLSGQAAILLKTSVITADVGSIVLNGQSVDLRRGFGLVAGSGSYALNGQDAGLTRTYIAACDYGSFALNGQDVTLVYGRAISAEQGSFAVAGQSANLLLSRVLSAVLGEFALTGQDVQFVRTGVMLSNLFMFRNLPSQRQLRLESSQGRWKEETKGGRQWQEQ